MVDDGTISLTVARKVLDESAQTGEAPASVVERRGLRQVSDVAALEAACREVLARHPAEAADLRAGKDKLFGFFVGQVMKATQGKANPGQLNELLKKKLAP
jgi:aspartyl-tRNA(Asn)/glutamyl-tRNA(Gln) amidotransferase subunit B